MAVFTVNIRLGSVRTDLSPGMMIGSGQRWQSAWALG